jgi:hypothetical protein
VKVAASPADNALPLERRVSERRQDSRDENFGGSYKIMQDKKQN